MPLDNFDLAQQLRTRHPRASAKSIPGLYRRHLGTCSRGDSLGVFTSLLLDQFSGRLPDEFLSRLLDKYSGSASHA